MDIITDLTAQAVTFITVTQDVCKNSLSRQPEESEDITGAKLQFKYKLTNITLWGTITENDFKTPLADVTNYDARLNEIIWHSYDVDNPGLLRLSFFKIASGLLRWIFDNNEYLGKEKNSETPVIYRSPFFWRQHIRDILYRKPDQRFELVKILEYLPLQVVFVIRKKNTSTYNQRLYQVYNPAFADLLSVQDRGKLKKWQEEYDKPDPKKLWQKLMGVKPQPKPSLKALIINDSDLLQALIEKEVALPFETFIGKELFEIESLRKLRDRDVSPAITAQHVDTAKDFTKTKSAPDLNDPLQKAQEMKLAGLAFSGGGIRSATFNLGILQKLASLNLLSRFDYLSTVSGGGYIGSWYTSWLMRSSSISKVTDRLCPDKSGDPLADEVRPIRWLRMFSNYLSPNASIMSPDAWTMGITWLRNTVINQCILLMILLTILLTIDNLYNGWLNFPLTHISFDFLPVFVSSLIVVAPVAFLAGFGMWSFDKKNTKKSNQPNPGYKKFLFKLFKRWQKTGNVIIRQLPALASGWNKIDKAFKGFFWKIYSKIEITLDFIKTYLAHFLIAWGALCSILITTWFYNSVPVTCGLTVKWNLLWWPCSVAGFLGMMLIALLGNYHQRQDLKKLGRANKQWQNQTVTNTRMIRHFKGEMLDKRHTFFTFIGIVVSSIVGILAGVFFLIISWQIIEVIYYADFKSFNVSNPTIGLVAGVPLVFEAISLSVVVRMAIMGTLFPDERREWWGRMGGLVHRFILIWLLVCSSALIIPDVFKSYAVKNMIGLWGGWTAIIGWAVKKAFDSKELSPNELKGSKGVTEIFIRVAPYLFMLGFLLIGGYLVAGIKKLCNDWVFLGLKGNSLCVLLTALLGLCTWVLSWRVGVNEFSLHHFYRNRLIRAYMGATRRRSDREETANSFTDFDTNDDMLLASMRSANGYIGPYPIINTALNATVVSALDRQDRKAESFMFSPLFCGYDFSPTRSAASNRNPVYEYGYRPTENFSDENGGPTLGTAMAISGAAVNPNWGYHSSAPIAFLLTVFNVRLGWWIGNPRLKKWKRSDPETGLAYLIKDLVGKSDINTDYVCLSDGGHFDNMGLYELIRRRCNYILLGDGEQDDNASCEGLANAIRRCRIDFGVEIDLDITNITKKDKDTGYCNAHIASGTITYPGSKESPGTIIYVKTALTGDESVDIREYAIANPEFPQQSTGDQFFDEAQFESYRKLGYHSINSLQDLKMQ
jgi:hypothetical protein